MHFVTMHPSSARSSTSTPSRVDTLETDAGARCMVGKSPNNGTDANCGTEMRCVFVSSNDILLLSWMKGSSFICLSGKTSKIGPGLKSPIPDRDGTHVTLHICDLEVMGRDSPPNTVQVELEASNNKW